MKALKSLIVLAALAATGAAFADSSTVDLNNASQTQTNGNRNKQDMQAGVVDNALPGSSSARVTATQPAPVADQGSRNTQTMILGKIDKNLVHGTRPASRRPTSASRRPTATATTSRSRSA